MPQDQNGQTGLQKENNLPQKPGNVDLNAILLPKKEVPKSTERINAGILLEQERSATLIPQESAPSTRLDADALPNYQSGTSDSPPSKKETSVVQPIQTYKGDIESLIKDKNVSVVNIAAAEAEKRARVAVVESSSPDEPSKLGLVIRNILMMLGGVALIAATIGVGLFIYFRLTATVQIHQDTPAPFIDVDKTTVITLPQSTLTHQTLIVELARTVQESAVSLGLIERLLPTAETIEGKEKIHIAIPSQLFLPTLAPAIPEELVRTLQKEFLLGIHMFDGPQSFLILHTDSYEHAFAAMITWERTMKDELLPLFNRTPRPRTPEETGATPTATSTLPIRTQFVDKIVENRDTRAVLNEQGDLLLLWTFLDRNIIVITTNEYTLREIITRLSAPVTPRL